MEMREFLAGTEEKSISPIRGHWFALQSNQWFFYKKKKDWVSGQSCQVSAEVIDNSYVEIYSDRDDPSNIVELIRSKYAQITSTIQGKTKRRRISKGKSNWNKTHILLCSTQFELTMFQRASASVSHPAAVATYQRGLKRRSAMTLKWALTLISPLR